MIILGCTYYILLQANIVSNYFEIYTHTLCCVFEKQKKIWNTRLSFIIINMATFHAFSFLYAYHHWHHHHKYRTYMQTKEYKNKRRKKIVDVENCYYIYNIIVICCDFKQAKRTRKKWLYWRSINPFYIKLILYDDDVLFDHHLSDWSEKGSNKIIIF